SSPWTPKSRRSWSVPWSRSRCTKAAVGGHVFAGFLLSYTVFLVYSSFHHAWSPWELRYHAYFMEDLPSPMVIVAGNSGY
uniref:Uncharacterized protein n=1 Tax=Aegilops tauschii subsp. strangulata TaxID=200361 RepID=A0A453EXD5_AEGTS